MESNTAATQERWEQRTDSDDRKNFFKKKKKRKKRNEERRESRGKSGQIKRAMKRTWETRKMKKNEIVENMR